MGFQSTISGYICIAEKLIGSGQANEEAKRAIASLPLAKDDTWPCLPREIFAATLRSEGGDTLDYDSTMLHFGMCVKDLDGLQDQWLTKFEAFFKSIPNAEEAYVVMNLVLYGRLTYLWTLDSVPIAEGGGEKWNLVEDSGTAQEPVT